MNRSSSHLHHKQKYLTPSVVMHVSKAGTQVSTNYWWLASAFPSPAPIVLAVNHTPALQALAGDVVLTTSLHATTVVIIWRILEVESRNDVRVTPCELLSEIRVCYCLVPGSCSGVTVRAATLRSKDQTCRETIAQCCCRRLKVSSHRQHLLLSTSARRNSTGWIPLQRRLVASTLTDQRRSIRLFQAVMHHLPLIVVSLSQMPRTLWASFKSL